MLKPRKEMLIVVGTGAVGALCAGVAEYLMTGGMSGWVPLWAGLVGVAGSLIFLLSYSWLTSKQTNETETLFIALGGDINEFLHAINTCLDNDDQSPFQLPKNWASMKSQAIGLTRMLDRLNIPHPPPFKPDDILLEEICQWHEYLSHLVPMAEAGELTQAREIIIENDTA